MDPGTDVAVVEVYAADGGTGGGTIGRTITTCIRLLIFKKDVAASWHTSQAIDFHLFNKGYGRVPFGFL